MAVKPGVVKGNINIGTPYDRINPYNKGTVNIGKRYDKIGPYNQAKKQDWDRTITNIAFLAVFIITIIAAFYVAIWQSNTAWANTKDLIQLILPIETALIGSVVGYYFGTKTGETHQ